MRELRTEIHINAPIEKVWSTLTSFDQWKEWNPTVTQASGNSALGEKLSITICGEDCKEAGSYNPVVLESNPPRSFRWSATMMAPFIFKNDRVFELSEKDGGTQVVHKEEYSGIMVSLFWKKLSTFALKILETMNGALKKHLEA